ncbi:Crp/Fnr family transcriptional regulator [Paenibacillus sp. 481]|nr:Crp/Fnr family transcriptional regulator [Paenibacillus sp. 481]
MITDLRQVNFLQDLPDHVLHEWELKLKQRQFKKNHTLIYEDDQDTDIYIVRSGSVKVFRLQEGKEIIYNFFFPGEMIGELEAIYPNQARIASIEAMEAVHAWVMSRSDFIELAEKHPSVLKRAYCQLVDHIRVLNRKVCYLSFMDVRRKTANLLLDLYYNLGREEDDRIKITYKFTHHVMANMIGVTRESLSKTLKEFQDEQLITLEQKHIYILDFERLTAMCESDVPHPKQRRWRSEDSMPNLL